MYAKSIVEMGELFVPLDDAQISKFYTGKDEKYEARGPFRTQPMEAARTLGDRPNLVYAIPAPDGSEIWPKRQWLWSKERVMAAISKDELLFTRNGDEWSVRIKQNLKDDEGNKREGKLFSIIDGLYTQEGSKEISGFMGNPQVFSYPKPSSLVKELIKVGTDNDGIILDFFSGSATTAHAIMQLNAEDGGNRRFIMVQLPEVTDDKSEAYKAGYRTICEIGKERIRRAGAKIKGDYLRTKAEFADGFRQLSIQGQEVLPMQGFAYFPDQDQIEELHSQYNQQLDTGFRVFKLDTSNLKVWDNSPVTGTNALTELEARIRGMLDILKRDRSDEDVVYEVMLKLGQDLCEPIIPIPLEGGRMVYGVGADVKFIVCLALHLTVEDAEVMASYAPGRIVFADQCFENSTDKSNVKLLLRDKDITIKVL
jgi:adenine-specific DNA-methyltransferase